MNIKALITTLFVVGSSTAALAQPASQGSVDVRDHRGYEQPAPTPAPAPIVRDHRTEAPTPAPIVRDHRDEITQVQPVAVDHDRDHDRDQRKLPSWMMLSSSDAIGAQRQRLHPDPVVDRAADTEAAGDQRQDHGQPDRDQVRERSQPGRVPEPDDR